MLGLQFPHAVRVKEVVEGNTNKLLPSVPQVALTTGRKKLIKIKITISKTHWATDKWLHFDVSGHG